MKKADTKAFLRSKADGVKKKNDDNAKKGSVAQAAAEPAGNMKEKKEKVLAAARKKMGMDEEQRQDYKQRAKKSKEKKQAAQSAETSSPGQTTAPVQAATTTATAATAAAPGRLRKKDLDPTRSAFSQRVDRTMERQGLTREAAKQVVTDRRAARKDQMATVQQQLNVGEDQSRRIVRYANKNTVTPTDGSAPAPDYALAQKVVRMARNKGLTKKEAGTIIAGRRQAQQDAAGGTQPQA